MYTWVYADADADDVDRCITVGELKNRVVKSEEGNIRLASRSVVI